MGKTLQILSLLSLVILGVGTHIAAQNPMFWLASGSGADQIISAVLGLILVLQLAIRVPRPMWFRVMSSVIAMTIGVWSVETMLTYHLLPLDTLAFVSAAIAIGINALETRLQSSDNVVTSNKKVTA